MLQTTSRLGLSLGRAYPTSLCFTKPQTIATSQFIPSRSITISTRSTRLTSIKLNAQPTTVPPPTTTPPSFFTPSLCRIRTRNASTSARAASDPTSAGTTNPTPSSVVLDWNSFFKLRTSRRRYSLISSIVAATGTTYLVGMQIAMNPDVADMVQKLIPTDPFVSFGAATLGALLLGWLLGPVLGNTIWKISHRARLAEFTIKERAFFDRIKKHRVNPSGAGANNPVPDYYGEKIGSVQGYRRWLKDQRAFNRKRGGNYPSTV